MYIYWFSSESGYSRRRRQRRTPQYNHYIGRHIANYGFDRNRLSKLGRLVPYGVAITGFFVETALQKRTKTFPGDDPGTARAGDCEYSP